MEVLTGLLAAAIGAVTALAGSYLTAQRQAQLEYKKWLRARDDEVAKDLRLAIAELMRKMATAAQTISWFTWEADYRPDQINKEAVEQYDNEMRSMFPQIDSALIVVSALNEEAYQTISPLVSEIYNLDLKVSRETRKLTSAQSEAIKGIAGYKDEAFQLKHKITNSVANIIRKVIPSK